MRILICAASLLVVTAISTASAQDKPKPPAQTIAPTHANVSYGDHEANVIDFWQAEGDGPRPLLVYIHGGGWIGGDKKRSDKDVKPFLDKGISYAAINYRLTGEASLPAPVHDAARAIQFIRSKADAVEHPQRSNRADGR